MSNLQKLLTRIVLIFLFALVALFSKANAQSSLSPSTVGRGDVNNAAMTDSLDARFSGRTTADFVNASGQTYSHPDGTSFTASTGTRTQSYLNTLVRQRLNALVDTLDAAKSIIAGFPDVSSGVYASSLSAVATGSVGLGTSNYIKIGSRIVWYLDMNTLDTDDSFTITLNLPAGITSASTLGQVTLITSPNTIAGSEVVAAEIGTVTASLVQVLVDRDDAINGNTPISVIVSARIL